MIFIRTIYRMNFHWNPSTHDRFRLRKRLDVSIGKTDPSMNCLKDQLHRDKQGRKRL
jgi:hypothetical protein